MWDNVPNAMKTLENLTVRLLKEDTLTKIFLEQDTNDKAFYSSGGRSFNKYSVEVKKKKQKIFTKFLKTMRCNYCHEKRHWEQECKKRKEDESINVNAATSGYYLTRC
jgi:hypothetical protein